MRRPRHRQKSRTLWTTLLIAALVNIVLWPVLARLGVFAGIRREVLIPVTLTSLPPSHKLPDTLTRVAKSGSTQPPSPPTMPSHSSNHSAPSPPTTTRTQSAAAVNRPAAPASPVLAATAHPRGTSNEITAKRIAPAKPAESAPHHASPPVAEKEASKPPPPSSVIPPRLIAAPRVAQQPEHRSTGDDNHREQMQMRIARADHLQALGQQVANRIAADRKRETPPTKPVTKLPAAPTTHVNDTQVAAQPTPTQSVSTVTPTPTTPDVVQALPKETPTSQMSSPPSVKPAVVIVQVQPTIPDQMQTSAWHAAFHGRFYIHPDGSATVVMVSSTGFPVLDQRALRAARAWKFHPAYQGKVPVASTRDFMIDYTVRADEPNISGN